MSLWLWMQDFVFVSLLSGKRFGLYFLIMVGVGGCWLEICEICIYYSWWAVILLSYFLYGTKRWSLGGEKVEKNSILITCKTSILWFCRWGGVGFWLFCVFTFPFLLINLWTMLFWYYVTKSYEAGSSFSFCESLCFLFVFFKEPKIGVL